MAALGQRGYWKSVLPAYSQIMFGRIRNKLIYQNGANFSNLWPESSSHSIFTCNRTLSSLSGNNFVLQQQHLRSRFCTCLQKISTRNKTSFSSVFLPAVCKNNPSFHSPLAQLLNTSSSSLFLRPHPTFDIQCRFRQKKKNRKSQEEEEENFSDDEIDELEEEFEEETNLPLNYKELKVYIKSPRADALLSTGLNISRAKIDSMFYANKLLHNDKPLTKKSKNLDEGDYVDLITEGNGKIKRVKVLKISSEKGRTDKMCLVLRAWRSPFSLESVEEES